jgi:hypothetical protein
MVHPRSASRRRWSSTKRSLGRNWPRFAMLLLFIIAGLSIVVLVINGLAAAGDGSPMPALLD